MTTPFEASCNCSVSSLHFTSLSLSLSLSPPSRGALVKIIKHDFGLTINIEDLINKIDSDGSGEIEFAEFKALLS